MSQKRLVDHVRARPLVKLTQRLRNFPAFRPSVIVDGATLYGGRMQTIVFSFAGWALGSAGWSVVAVRTLAQPSASAIRPSLAKAGPGASEVASFEDWKSEG